MLKIILDVRESGLSKDLKNLGTSHEVKSLDIGDIVLTRQDDSIVMILERKTMSDLYSSIVDGRHASQKERLADYKTQNDAVKIVYLLETGDFKKLTEKQRNVIRGVLENTVLRNVFQVLVSYDTAMSAHMLKSIATKMTDPKFAGVTNGGVGEIVSGAFRPSGHSKVSVLANQLGMVHGIGPAVADHFAKQYKNMKEMIQYLDGTTVDELSNIKVNGRRIGKSKAQAIFDGLVG